MQTPFCSDVHHLPALKLAPLRGTSLLCPCTCRTNKHRTNKLQSCFPLHSPAKPLPSAASPTGYSSQANWLPPPGPMATSVHREAAGTVLLCVCMSQNQTLPWGTDRHFCILYLYNLYHCSKRDFERGFSLSVFPPCYRAARCDGPCTHLLAQRLPVRMITTWLSTATQTEQFSNK